MERKLHEISGSLAITIPKQIYDLYGLKNGDMLSIDPIGVDEMPDEKQTVDLDVDDTIEEPPEVPLSEQAAVKEPSEEEPEVISDD